MGFEMQFRFETSIRVAHLLFAAALYLVLSATAEARPARCFTTDEGRFRCDFRMTDRDGSFQISAPGKPSYILRIDQEGVAFGFANLGGRNTPLPGRYLRSKTERGCWVNDTTAAKICAY
jgi:hypothetical protein